MGGVWAERGRDGGGGLLAVAFALELAVNMYCNWFLPFFPG